MRSVGKRVLLLLTVLGACEGDRTVRQDGQHESSTLPIGATMVEGRLVLANTPRPLNAARYRADSATTPIELAHVEVSAVAGDTVALVAKGDAQSFESAGQKVRLMATVGGVTKSYPLTALRTGVTIFRASASGTISISYRLSRDVKQPIAGEFQLVQQSNAQVVTARRPWGPSARPTRMALSSASACSGSGCPTQCYLGAATGDCAGSIWNITPYVAGAPFCCFQSSPGSGQQYPITLTFSKPISAIQITIADPTYSGNTMTAYGPDGSLVGSVSFAYNGVPGEYSEDTKQLTGTISQVVLTNDPNDYIAYNGWIEVAPDSVTVDCTQPVTRGNPITCTALPADPAASVQVTEWKFSAPGLANPIIEASSTPWQGKAVIDGTVTVTASLNGGAAKTYTKQIAVQARPWNTSADTVQWSIDTLSQAADVLPDKPTLLANLGITAPFAGISVPSDGYEQVSSGPNKGLWFFTKVPVEGKPTTAVNKIALKDSSEFWAKQPKSSGSINVCKRADVAPFLPKVIDHEGFPNGYTSPPASHTGSLRAELNRRTPKVTEPIWSSVGEVDLESKATAAAQPEIDAAIKWSKDQKDGGSVPPVTYCSFKYF